MSDESLERAHVKISRKAYKTDPFWLEERPFSRWEAWEDMIAMSAWKARVRMVVGEPVKLARGEFMGSERFLAERWSWSSTKVRAFLALCAEMGRIKKQREVHRGTVYLLVNYEKYQGTTTEKEAQEDAPTKHRESSEKANEEAVKQISITTTPSSSVTPLGPIGDRLTAEGRRALEGLVRGSRNGDGLLAEVMAMLEGMRGKEYHPTAEAMSLALVDLTTNGEKPTANMLRAYVKSAERVLAATTPVSEKRSPAPAPAPAIPRVA